MGVLSTKTGKKEYCSNFLSSIYILFLGVGGGEGGRRSIEVGRLFEYIR